VIAFKKIDISSYLYNIFQIFFKKEFKGWGRKKSGRFAALCHKNFGGTLVLQEDGFIRSLGLGIDGSPSFSLVEDDLGIYYDATMPSRLEKILNEYDFASDIKLMSDARSAIAFLVEHNISKYNNALDAVDKILNQVHDDKSVVQSGTSAACSAATRNQKRILIIAQTAGDASLEYGMLEDYTTQDMINAALSENPDARIYLKIHPDVLSGKKKSDIDMAMIDSRVHVITQNVNPIALLKQFDKVYTKTSGMGFEALLVGCECVCFGMPFYAGWGITDDRNLCVRREKKLTIEEVFAGAYILYTKYYNPYEKRVSDIFDTMQTIVKKRG